MVVNGYNLTTKYHIPKSLSSKNNLKKIIKNIDKCSVVYLMINMIGFVNIRFCAEVHDVCVNMHIH